MTASERYYSSSRSASEALISSVGPTIINKFSLKSHSSRSGNHSATVPPLTNVQSRCLGKLTVSVHPILILSHNPAKGQKVPWRAGGLVLCCRRLNLAWSVLEYDAEKPAKVDYADFNCITLPYESQESSIQCSGHIMM